MTEGSGAKGATHPFTDKEGAQGQDVFGLGEPERQAVLAWVGENPTQVRRSVYPTATPVLEPGDRLGGWPGRACRWLRAVVFVQVFPEAKRRQFKQALDAYKAAQGDPARAGGDQALGDDEAPTAR